MRKGEWGIHRELLFQVKTVFKRRYLQPDSVTLYGSHSVHLIPACKGSVTRTQSNQQSRGDLCRFVDAYRCWCGPNSSTTPFSLHQTRTVLRKNSFTFMSALPRGWLGLSDSQHQTAALSLWQKTSAVAAENEREHFYSRLTGSIRQSNLPVTQYPSSDKVSFPLLPFLYATFIPLYFPPRCLRQGFCREGPRLAGQVSFSLELQMKASGCPIR